MIRRAFTMRLKPGELAEYKRKHDNIWPELVREIEKSGIASITTFERDPDLFLFSEIKNEKAWDRLWGSEIHKRWGDVMVQHMHFKDGIVDFGELREIFHCEPKLAKNVKRPKTKVSRGRKPARGRAKRK